MDEQHRNLVDATAMADHLLFVALVPLLIERGIVSAEMMREIIDGALLNIEQQRAKMPESFWPTCDMAREQLAALMKQLDRFQKPSR